MKSTKARKEFKDRFGQANHFLVTSLVGLNLIEASPSVEKPEEFRTSWNPINKDRSARRSRTFVLNSFLSYAVDGIDMYLSSLNRSPKVLDNPSFSLIYDKAQNSVYNKVIGIEDYFQIDKTLTALVLLLITWRNNIVHGLAENKIKNDYELQLIQEQQYIKETFRGLIIIDAIDRAYKGDDPHFKEVASLINATHMFVEIVDQQIIKKIDKLQYAKNVIAYVSKENETSRTKLAILPPLKRERLIKNLLFNHASFENSDVESIKDKLNKNAP